MSPEIILKSPGRELKPLEPGRVRYVVARGGIFRDRATPLFTTTTRVEGELPELEPHREQCTLHCRAIPTPRLREMIGFLQYAYDLHGGEAALVLLYSPEQDDFAWYCPEQTVRLYTWRGKYYAEDFIEFEYPLEVPAGWVQFGDAHSHIGSPHPSQIDRADERYRDGLHLIVGNIGGRQPTYHAEFLIDGQRFELLAETLFEELPEPPYPPPPDEWRRKIHLVKPRSYGGSFYGNATVNGNSYTYGTNYDPPAASSGPTKSLFPSEPTAPSPTTPGSQGSTQSDPGSQEKDDPGQFKGK